MKTSGSRSAYLRAGATRRAPGCSSRWRAPTAAPCAPGPPTSWARFRTADRSKATSVVHARSSATPARASSSSSSCSSEANRNKRSNCSCQDGQLTTRQTSARTWISASSMWSPRTTFAKSFSFCGWGGRKHVALSVHCLRHAQHAQFHFLLSFRGGWQAGTVPDGPLIAGAAQQLPQVCPHVQRHAALRPAANLRTCRCNCSAQPAAISAQAAVLCLSAHLRADGQAARVRPADRAAQLLYCRHLVVGCAAC